MEIGLRERIERIERLLYHVAADVMYAKERGYGDVNKDFEEVAESAQRSAVDEDDDGELYERLLDTLGLDGSVSRTAIQLVREHDTRAGR